jgi:O-antigen/teichoic acid export membrane protein
MSDRLAHVGAGGLRRHAARGVMINTGFLVGASVLNLVRGFALAAFLTATDYGVWGTVLVMMMLLLFFKQVGIGDKYIQQDEADQEEAFQKAFTLEVGFSALATVLVVASAPLIALAYGDDRLLGATLAFAALVPAWALQMPILAHYRQMRYLRQAALQAVEPVVVTAVSLALAVAGAGYWAIFGGLVAGAWAMALFAVATSPYPLRLRYDRGTAREYWSFSWPLFVNAAGGVAITVSAIVAANVHLGLAGAGVVTLSANISAFTARVDALVTQTLYPAVCAVADRLDLLRESFVKSNRLALMWAVPFGFGLTLFADDLVTFVLGPERWSEAIVLLQVYGVTAAIGQIGFNWHAYFRARGETRPLAVTSVGTALVFLLTGIPLLFAFGLPGFAAGVAIQMLANLALRVFFLTRLFAGFDVLAHMGRALLPVVPAAALTLALRLLVDARSLALALAELALFMAACAAGTWLLERPLLREALGYLRPAAVA